MLSIGVMATNINDKYKQQIDACLQTWCKDAEERDAKVYFFGGYIAYTNADGSSYKNYINLPNVGENFGSAFYKQFLGLKWLYDNSPSQWYHLVGTDTYVNIANLIKLIKNYKSTDDICLGGHGDERQIGLRRIYFHSGGSGFVF